MIRACATALALVLTGLTGCRAARWIPDVLATPLEDFSTWPIEDEKAAVGPATPRAIGDGTRRWLWHERHVLCHDTATDTLTHAGGPTRADFVQGLFVVDRELWVVEADRRGATVRHEPLDGSGAARTDDIVFDVPAAGAVRLAATARFLVVEREGPVGHEDEAVERWILDRATARAARGATGGVLDPVREAVVSSPGGSARLARFEIAPLGSGPVARRDVALPEGFRASFGRRGDLVALGVGPSGERVGVEARSFYEGDGPVSVRELPSGLAREAGPLATVRFGSDTLVGCGPVVVDPFALSFPGGKAAGNVVLRALLVLPWEVGLVASLPIWFPAVVVLDAIFGGPSGG